MSNTTIACPECKHEFHPEEALEKAIRQQMDGEFKAKENDLINQARAEGERNGNEKLSLLQGQLDQLNKTHADQLRVAKDEVARLNSEKVVLENQNKELDEKKKSLEDRERNLENTLQEKSKEYEKQVNDRFLAEFRRREQQLEDERRQLETKYLQKVNEEVEKVNVTNDLRVRELEKKLSDQNLLVEEMQRKVNQGSMQLQGEVAELMIEEELRNSFPLDEIQPVPKGLNGADCIQVVFNPERVECGRIIYESKRTKHFSQEWIDKLKADMRTANCGIAVLVTEALPKDMYRFGFMDGVWVCTFVEFKNIALILRSGLIRVGDIMMSQENKGSKMQMLYDYLTGTQFRGHVENIIDAFNAMKEGLEKEKKVTIRLWAERDKQLERILIGTSSMYGSVRGISGSAIGEIKGLEHDETLLLENNN